VLELASPPQLFRLKSPVIPVAGGHPFSRYICRHFFPFTLVDTSGGNVTHAAVSVADILDAREMVLHGADFCYPAGKLYARGTYLYSYFTARQNRTAGIEAQCSRFLLERNDLTLKADNTGTIVYGTALLDSYREKLGEAAQELRTPLITVGENTAAYTGNRAERREDRPPAGPRRDWAGFCAKLLGELQGIPLGSGGIQRFLASLEPRRREFIYALMPLAAFYLERDNRGPGIHLLEQAISQARHILAGSLAEDSGGGSTGRHVGDGPVADE